MRQALVTGGGPLAKVVAEVLANAGWAVRSGEAADLAEKDRLLVVVAAPARDGLVPQLAMLAQTMADHLPPPTRDDTGELRAPGQMVLVLDQSAQVAGLGPVEPGVAQAAALRWLPDAALTLAPRLRVNALCCDSALAADDLAPVLGWLTTAHAVTGQVLTLGPVPRLASPWRGAASGQGHFT